MDKATLVNLDISEGSEMISALESHGIELEVALWMVTPEYEDGRLVIASKMLPLKDVLEDYEKVVRILRETTERTLPLFLIFRPDDPFVVALLQLFRNTRSASGMRLGGQRIGNRYVEDAYVYKIG